MPNKMPEIAAEMRAEAAQATPSQRRLSKGLHLSLHARPQPDGQLWLLVLSREDVPPGATEIDTCRRVFGVPTTASELTTNRLTSICWIERPIPEGAPVDVAPSAVQAALF